MIGGAALAVLVLLVPLAAAGQPAGKVPRVGFVVAGSAPNPYVDAFRQGLRELGYLEGRTVALEVRYAEGRPERFPALIGELVRLNVDVIVAGGGERAARLARQATATIPIVTPAVADPVSGGLVASLARPGGNLTGLSMLNTEISGKRLELLKALLPRMSRVAILWDPASETSQMRASEAAGRILALQVDILEARTPGDFPSAFAEARKRRADAMLVLASSFFNSHRKRLVELAATGRLPAVWEQRDFAEAGGLMSYGPNLADMYRRAATYVDKILKGARPAELPIEQDTTFELILNARTASALGLTFPPSLRLRADQVIE